MAHVASNKNGNTNLPMATPFMDRMTHSVIKETSKNLRYYIDVKRRENAFVLNPNSTSLDSIPLKARFMYGTTKEYPPLYASHHSDSDVKGYLRSFQPQQRLPYSTSESPEKQMCREELNFHMRTYKYSPGENHEFGGLRIKPSTRSSSSFSRTSGHDIPRRSQKSPQKLSRREHHRLVNDTADILASLIKTRRSLYESNFLSQQITPVYDSRNTNPSPRQPDEQSNISSPSLTHPTPKIIKQKHTTEDPLEKAASIMHNAKAITKGLLCQYKVSVTTGNCNGASTNAPIRIKFYGTNGYTNFLDLDGSETHRVPFLKDQTDVFTIETYHVGQLAGITIGHDRKDMRSGWFLNKLSIYDPIREITSEIPCNAWLSSKANDQKTMRDFQVATTISHKNYIDSDEHREETDSQSGSSSTAEGTVNTSSTTKLSQDDQSAGYKRTKKDRKHHRVSIGPTTVGKKPASLAATTHHHSPPPTATTLESHFNRNEFLPPSVPTRRTHSPIISSLSSSDTEVENNVVNHNRSSTSAPSPTFDQSQIRFKPSPRSDKPSSPRSVSSEKPIKNKEETDENDALSFFD